MKRSFTTAMASLISMVSLLLTGCASSDEVVYQSQYQGQNAVVKAHQTSNFNGTRTDWRIQWGDLPELPVNITLMYANPVPLNGETTTDWGRPTATIFMALTNASIGERRPPTRAPVTITVICPKCSTITPFCMFPRI